MVKAVPRVCACLGAFGAIVAGLVLCEAAAAKEISCQKSGVTFDRNAYPATYQFLCKKETVDEDSFDRLRATKGKNWQQLIEFGQAFLPPNSLVEGALMSSSAGRYGSVYMVTAIGPVHLTEPKLKQAIEAMTKANPLGVPGTVTWRNKESIDEYSVDFYGQNFPEGNVGGGPRECMGFVRYIHGTPPSHPQRLIGTYCEIGQQPLDSARAASVLKTLVVRPGAVE
jgi:hypothetical protein